MLQKTYALKPGSKMTISEMGKNLPDIDLVFMQISEGFIQPFTVGENNRFSDNNPHIKWTINFVGIDAIQASVGYGYSIKSIQA